MRFTLLLVFFLPPVLASGQTAGQVGAILELPVQSPEKDVAGLTSHIDLMPTLMEFCGVEKPAPVEFDGISLAPLLRREAAVSERKLFVEHLGDSYSRPTFELIPFDISAVLTSRWRLVFGKELYDLTRDPMQRTDVAAQHPNVVRELRKEHERWFSDVTRRISEPCRIVLGDPAENPVHLNLQDWYISKGNAPWYQRHFGPYVHVSSDPAPYVNGKWTVEVAQSGRYEFTLRQLPREADFVIPAVEARLKVGQVDKTRMVPTGAKAVKFAVELDAGPQSLQTWFTQAGGKSRGAFYVEVRRMDDAG